MQAGTLTWQNHVAFGRCTTVRLLALCWMQVMLLVFLCKSKAMLAIWAGSAHAVPRAGLQGLPWCRRAHPHRHMGPTAAVAAVSVAHAVLGAGLAATSKWLSHIGANSQAGTTLHLAKWCWVQRLALVQAC